MPRHDTGDDTLRTVTLGRLDEGVYLARNPRGGQLRFGSHAGDDFTPVELLLAAVAGCSAVDVDVVTGRRAPAERFEVTARAHKVPTDGAGSTLRDIEVTFTVRFGDDAAGDAARAVLPRALKASHDRTCTVSRTIEAGTPVLTRLDQDDAGSGTPSSDTRMP
jgi:putative redox protein